ncbi:unnamed protein product [Rotaria sp. Silwood1]|nr:unnamed protein product [Rotaria sp. Silwood1]CAF1625365.1 unnamed protein product [Rotaria sp. Silwood1]CAF3751324.1 unnamed protein product [Rotaria sp. Silwood1]CAF3856893.1 unnamed protein product [Rotaria sp. Silwood1]
MNITAEFSAVENLIAHFQNLFLEKEKQWHGPFFFAQGADCQPGLTYRWTGTEALPITSDMPITWDVEIASTRAVIEKINRMEPKPRFFIICGDIVDAFPNPSIPLVCVSGNHDVGNQPTRDSIQRYIDHFGDDYFDFYCGSVHCIVINSQFYVHSANVEDLKREHEEWLDRVLSDKQSTVKHTIIFQHIPWFLNYPDQKKDYFNMEIETQTKILEKFHAAGVKKIFCGHYHRNARGSYKSMEQIVTSAIGLQLGKDKAGIRLVRVTKDEVQDQYFPTDELPTNF